MKEYVFCNLALRKTLFYLQWREGSAVQVIMKSLECFCAVFVKVKSTAWAAVNRLFQLWPAYIKGDTNQTFNHL